MISASEATRRLLPYSFLKGVGAVTLRKIVAMPDFLNTSEHAISESEPRVRKAFEHPDAWQCAKDEAEHQLRCAEDTGARILSLLDDDYPNLLKNTKDDPCILYIKGELPPTSISSVAIVGTRTPTTHGEIITERITKYFVDNGWSIVSGLALGCDTIAHETALKHGGHTTAVLAHGLQTISPKSNQALAGKILCANGALVTEYPFGSEAIPAQFVKRDKTQAGLAHGVVMAQSSVEGGSLHASRASIRYGRWLAVPYPTERDLGEANAAIGANILFTSDRKDEIAELLKCEESALSNIRLLRGKEDYHTLLDSSPKSSLQPETNQPSLL